MRRDEHDIHRHDDENEGAISKKEVDRFAQDAFRQVSQGMSKAEIGKTEKVLGILEMDAGLAKGLDGIINLGADYLSSELRPRAFKIADQLAPRFKISQPTGRTIAAVAAIGGTAALKMSNYFGKIYRGFADHVAERRQLAHDIAPVLDDIKGGHSILSLQRVGEKDNEVIFAHRGRIGKIATAQNTSNIVDLLINSGASLAFDGLGLARVWNKRQDITSHELHGIFNGTPSQAQVDQQVQNLMPSLGGWDALKKGIITLLPSFSERYVATSQQKLAKELAPYSALEMILELQQQASGNPDVARIQEPRNYKDPRARRKEFPLEEYLVRIFIQHQKDMAWLKPEEHTEIRPSLEHDLTAAVRPMAKAIRAGDLSPMSLVRLIGEGRIIQKHGRAIATEKEIQALIEKEAPKQASYDQANPAEHFDEAKEQDKDRKATHEKTRVEKPEYYGRVSDKEHKKHYDQDEEDAGSRRSHAKHADHHRETSDEREVGYGY